jgi:hypothetical protein
VAINCAAGNSLMLGLRIRPQHLRCGQQKRRREVFDHTLVWQLPADFGGVLQQARRALRIAQEQQGRAGDTTVRGEPGFVQKLHIAPAGNLGSPALLLHLLGEFAASEGQRIRVEIIDAGLGHHRRTPVVGRK